MLTLALLLLLQADEDALLRERAAKCGSEVRWAADWSEAAARAKDERKLILIAFQNYPGFEVGDLPSIGPFMEPDIVALTNARFVPLRFRLGMEAPFTDPALYGTSPTSFGVALMLAKPDGEILRETFSLDTTVAYEFLRGGLHGNAGLAGPPSPPEPPRGTNAERALAAAEWLLACGELEEAEARIERCAQAGGTPRLARGAKEEGVAVLRALALAEPETRWSWWAAAAVTNPMFAVQERWILALPTAEQIEEGLPFAPGPLKPRDVARARSDARGWLLARQREDGSWGHPYEIGTAHGDDPPHIGLGATALAGIALMRASHALFAEGDKSDARTAAAAAGRALEYLARRAAALRSRTAHEPEVLMDYSVWSHPYAILLAAECLPHRVGDAAAARAMAADAVAVLAAKQKSGGGWSYYLSGTVEGSAQPHEASMSFTTAAVLNALLRAPEAGAAVAPEKIVGAVGCLEGMRREDGAFVYLVEHTLGYPVGGTPGDAAGRGPACALALHRAGRADLDAVRARLRLFVEHLPELAREQGKVLMHCGPEAQGSHYLLFDYMNAAEAVAALPAAERAEFRAPLLAAILAARNADGSFVDNPQIGRPAGTAMALIALQALAAER